MISAVLFDLISFDVAIQTSYLCRYFLDLTPTYSYSGLLMFNQFVSIVVFIFISHFDYEIDNRDHKNFHTVGNNFKNIKYPKNKL